LLEGGARPAGPLPRATTTRQRASVLDQVTTGGSLLGERLPDQRVARPAAWRVLGQPGEIDGLPHVTGRVWVKAGSVENVDHIVLVLEGQVEEGLGHLVASDVEHEILDLGRGPNVLQGVQHTQERRHRLDLRGLESDPDAAGVDAGQERARG